MRINFNPGSAQGVYRLGQSYQQLMKTMEKLSSGLRINRASDDPAGLVISEKMRSQIASLNQEIENTSLTINKYNTADSTVNQLRSVLQGIRVMAVGAANCGLNNENTIDAYQSATDRAVANYNHIIDTASFNNAGLLDGGERAVADISSLENIDLSDPQSAENALKQIDRAMAGLDQVQVEIGSTEKYDLEAKRSNLEVTAQNLTAAESEIRDADYPQEIANMIQNKIRINVSVALLAHAQVNHRAVLSLIDH
jgi:flagellin